MAENEAVSPARGRPAATVSSPRRAGARPLPRRLHRATLADQVADTVRGMILTGEIAAETPVTQSEIARLLGVSTMPAREALLRLGAEGFLIASPNRSFTVRRITEHDIRDIYWMHAVLAGELTQRACLQGDESLIRELRESEAEFVAAWNQGDGEGAMDRANWPFHRMINKAAEAPKLWMLLNATLRFIPTRFYVLVPAWADESKRGHTEIVRAPRSSMTLTSSPGWLPRTHVRAAGELLLSSSWRSGRLDYSGTSRLESQMDSINGALLLCRVIVTFLAGPFWHKNGQDTDGTLFPIKRRDALSSSDLGDRKLPKLIASPVAKGGMLGFVRRNQPFARFALQTDEEIAYPSAGPPSPRIGAGQLRTLDYRMDAFKLGRLGGAERL